MKQYFKIPLLLGFASSSLLFGGCASHGLDDSYYSPPRMQSSVIIGVFDYPRYLDAPYYVYRDRYYYGGHYRNGYYYYRGKRLHRGHYYHRGYRYHYPRYRRDIRRHRCKSIHKRKRDRKYYHHNYYKSRDNYHGKHEYRRY